MKQFRILKPLLIFLMFITASGTVRNLSCPESQTSLQLSPSRYTNAMHRAVAITLTPPGSRLRNRAALHQKTQKMPVPCPHGSDQPDLTEQKNRLVSQLVCRHNQ